MVATLGAWLVVVLSFAAFLTGCMAPGGNAEGIAPSPALLQTVLWDGVHSLEFELSTTNRDASAVVQLIWPNVLENMTVRGSVATHVSDVASDPGFLVVDLNLHDAGGAYRFYDRPDRLPRAFSFTEVVPDNATTIVLFASFPGQYLLTISSTTGESHMHVERHTLKPIYASTSSIVLAEETSATTTRWQGKIHAEPGLLEAFLVGAHLPAGMNGEFRRHEEYLFPAGNKITREIRGEPINPWPAPAITALLSEEGPAIASPPYYSAINYVVDWCQPAGNRTAIINQESATRLVPVVHHVTLIEGVPEGRSFPCGPERLSPA